VGVGAGIYMYDVIVKKFSFAISSPKSWILAFVAVKWGMAVWDILR